MFRIFILFILIIPHFCQIKAKWEDSVVIANNSYIELTKTIVSEIDGNNNHESNKVDGELLLKPQHLNHKFDILRFNNNTAKYYQCYIQSIQSNFWNSECWPKNNQCHDCSYCINKGCLRKNKQQDSDICCCISCNIGDVINFKWDSSFQDDITIIDNTQFPPEGKLPEGEIKIQTTYSINMTPCTKYKDNSIILIAVLTIMIVLLSSILVYLLHRFRQAKQRKLYSIDNESEIDEGNKQEIFRNHRGLSSSDTSKDIFYKERATSFSQYKQN